MMHGQTNIMFKLQSSLLTRQRVTDDG